MRISEIQDVLERAGTIHDLKEIKPYNQLRGSFRYGTENGTIDIFFTLTPESTPKVQYLNISFQPDGSQ